ncbi:MAG: sugar ABC transporter ATP-binding protein [Anaerolineae bacterium]|nr:sugar ABC transporter ATP-binding protein [Anaerolineales bacterium]MCQ3979333.1 sugar ABC transporter ATP-binding protein [Anaerolineae bacterium]
MNPQLVPPEPLLSFRGVVKRFGGTLAVDRVDLEVYRGSILALLGENGAGKSTLIKCLAGIHRLDAGEMRMHGRRPDGSTEHWPISFIHQDLGLIDWMTVAENMAMTTGYPRRLGLVDWPATERQAAKALELVGGGINPRARIFNLSRTEKSLVAIARALAVEAELLVLDEPTASLPEADVARLFDALNRLRERGMAMIYISHRLDEVFRLADRVAVMRDGRLIGTRQVAQTSEKELVHMIVGRSPAEVFSKAPSSQAKPVLELRQVWVDEVGPVSFQVRAGEMVGLAGLRGAGQEIIGRALFGLEPLSAGEVRLNGAAPTLDSPGLAIRAGIGFVSSNRQEESLAMNLLVRENLFMNPAVLGRKWLEFQSSSSERLKGLALVDRFGVQPPETEREAFTLSGGNQQKVVLARWLNIGGKLLILEEPTQGVDVGAKAEIYGLLNQAMANGLAVLVVSTDFEEIANVCHRALVFNRGRIVAELHGDSLSMASLVQCASGAIIHQ